RNVYQACWLDRAVTFTEQTHLIDGTSRLLGGLECDAHRCQQAGPMTVDRIKGPCPDERFNHAPVDNAFVHPVAEIEQVRIRPILVPRPDNCRNGGFSRSLYRTQAIPYGFFVYRNKAIT